ncbi:MAG TPA: phosphohistidine phosphatase SixA [Candidatus Limnocylindria bacterium]|nr:phosphohistidine phosphatase SixA [Candidatus Limnocylindria bacterium]
MRIYLFRHGPAGSRDSSRWPDDSLRPLSPRGAERTERAARGLARLEADPTSVLSSPLVRCMQTAKLLREALELETTIETLDALVPGGSVRATLQRLSQFEPDDAVFLVGHEPDLGKLAGGLLFGAGASSVPLKKAGACLVAFDGPIKAGGGELRAFLPPRVLRGIARKQSRV